MSGVQRVHVRQTAVLEALQRVCHPAPKPEEGILKLQLPKASWEMALLPVRTAAGRSAQRPGGVPGAR